MKTFAIFLFASLLISVPNVHAQIGGPPAGFTYQGEIVTAGGNPITNGNHTFTFVLTKLNGTTIYSQGPMGLTLKNGIFDVVIGGFNGTFSSSLVDFNQPYLLQVIIDGDSLPPTEIWSSPYALNSGMVNGLQASATPASGELFPVPLSTDVYTGTAKINTNFLPKIPNNLLATPGIETINGVNPDGNGNFTVSAINGISVTASTDGILISGPASGIPSIAAGPGLQETNVGTNYTLSVAPAGINASMIAPGIQLGSAASGPAMLTVADSEVNGGKAFVVKGGMGANNPTGLTDGTGLSPGSPQTFWADQINVPGQTTTSLAIYNTLVSSTSTIVITPYGLNASVGQLAITSQGAGTFTISSTTPMGVGQGGSIIAMNYMVVNH